MATASLMVEDENVVASLEVSIKAATHTYYCYINE